MKLLTKEQQESHENAKICFIRKEKFENEYLRDKKYSKIRDGCHHINEYRGVLHISYVIWNTVHLKKFL